jgi:hypothetical protein
MQVMNEKRRLTRVRWVKDSSMEEATPVENNPTYWTALPAGNNPPMPRPAFPVENSPPMPRPAFPAGNNPPMPRPAFPIENTPQQSAAAYMEGYAAGEEESYAANEEEVFEEEGVSYNYELLSEDDLNGEVWLEDDELLEQEQDFAQEDVKHPLSSALLVLVALYIICGLAPLFVALFVSLRIFFWLEIGGWAIILAWLIIGVRPPLMIWIKERKKQTSEQILG